ncbi:MAG: DnaJ domain-containing protein [Proteobacteria bacterium]|nr:DnaJ domain-containing protein [Pseudomonadota bacterium]MDE2410406.1 DnaJ domain-containing protein [Sphingomonadales bacterium]
MTGESSFIDYYSTLEVHPRCDAKTLDAAYRRLAKRYHPDHPESADVDRLNAVIAAYRVLRDGERRAEYDVVHAANVVTEPHDDPAMNGTDTTEQSALGDDETHARILMFLYKRRREDASNAGVGEYYLQEMLGTSGAHLDFHLWYLKSKGFLEITEEGTLAITVVGVDHVIATSRSNATEKIVIAQLRGPHGPN